MDMDDLDNIEPVYQYMEETLLPDWSRYNFLTATDAIEWSIIQGGVITITSMMGNLVSIADDDDFDDPEFMEILGTARGELEELIEQARDWWKDKER